MATALKIEVLIPVDHRLEMHLPASLPAGPAEVTVRPLGVREPGPRRRGKGMDAGQGWIAEDFDAPLPAELLAGFEGDR
jgi:hypothetical protein